jgi:hypothetical protein
MLPRTQPREMAAGRALTQAQMRQRIFDKPPGIGAKRSASVATDQRAR